MRNVTENKWNKLSLIIPSDVDYKYNFRIGFFVTNYDNLNISYYFDNLLFVDLTETFGEGNEPDKEWCDNHIDYFDGSSTIYK